MTLKQRLSASVDADLLEAGKAAVAAGEAGTLSEWVNDALRQKAEHDRRLRAAAEFIAAYEAEHGKITEDEIEKTWRRAKAGATVVRGGRIMMPTPDDT
jgi:hypothetical protein